ncbi:DUF4837 family protein [Namhaeicola litoreus]|uniref:DUF4837 family protein n=1 Tax=Namhaeicola litoreus TaxID=1052145 RepID=A0ABW3Y0A7_9FLAO
MSKIYSLVLVIFLFISCNSKNDSITLVESTGRINNLLVVMNNEDWDGRLGDSVRAILAKPLVGLPQEEAPFSVNQVDPGAFSSLFKRSRNVLYIDYAEKENYYTTFNVYSSPQTILTILGTDINNILSKIEKYKYEMISVFKKQDLALYQSKITKDHWKAENIQTMENLGFSIKIPTTYNVVEDDGSFLWYRYSFAKGMLNIIAYSFPIKDRSEFNPLNIIKKRDSIGKTHIPGQFENTYMKTEPLYNPTATKMKLDNKEAYEIRGLWIVKNDFMGGPFVNYAILDEAQNRVLVLEGFSYSPATKKRDFVFEMEAILKTIQIE